MSLDAQRLPLSTYAKQLKNKKSKKLSDLIIQPYPNLHQNRFASLRKIALNVHKQLNFQKLSINIARKMLKNCEFTLILTDFSKTCSGKEIIWLYRPALNDMSALQESF